MDKTDKLLDMGRNIFNVRYKASERLGKEFFLSPIEVEILVFIYVFPQATTATEIERSRNIKKNTISLHVENPVQMGLIERSERQGDRRKIVLTLTDKAKSIAKRCWHEYENIAVRLQEGLSEEEKETVRHCFDIINDNAARILSEPTRSENV